MGCKTFEVRGLQPNYSDRMINVIFLGEGAMAVDFQQPGIEREYGDLSALQTMTSN